MDKQNKLKFRRLVNAHHRLVYSIALRILNDGAEAEDVSQEVYERAWKRINDIEETRAQAWLSQVTRNLCIDRLRQRKPIETGDELINTTECPNSGPAVSAAEQQCSKWLQSAISKLKEPYKTLILILDIQQLSVKDASEQTKLSENQVKVYRHRARKQLKALLQGIEL